MISRCRSGRLSAGGDRIDRAQPLTFTFEGVVHSAYKGDTLASALLANGIDCVSASPVCGRPRGIMTAGVEEPNALVRVRRNAVEEPMLRATMVEVVEGLEAWSVAGKGRLAAEPDSARYDKAYAHCDVLVIGGGASGRSAALDAVRSRQRVILIDDGPSLDSEIAKAATLSISTLTVLSNTTVLGLYDHGYAIAAQRSPTRAIEGRLWHIRAGRTVIATGAIERPIVFADNDRPGIMLASSAAMYVRRYGVRPGERAVIFTTNASTGAAARILDDAAVDIVEVVDVRRGDLVVSTEGDDTGRLSAVTIGRRDASGPHRRVTVDLLLVSGGWNPNVSLWSQSRGTLRFDERIAAFVPNQAFAAVSIVGTATGVGLPDVDPLWLVPPVKPDASDAWASHFLDLERDATVADLRDALDAGLTDPLF